LKNMVCNRLGVRAIVAVSVLLGSLHWAAAADYPARPMRMVVGFAAGGATDLFARIVAQKLTERLGQQVVVDNRTGAGGSLGTALVAKAPSDGYTLAIISASHSINASLYKSLPFDPVSDFEPVAPLCSITKELAPANWTGR
jgi:tripartite-type tricarboxylate transporter receptor subunit TctC